MKKQTMITLALALTLAMPTMPAFAQKAMSKKEIAEKEKAFKNLQHPWKGKKVAYFGDSITDPRIKASKVKYWGFLQDWLGITPYVYGVSGRQWNDIPRQADLLQKEHGDDFDAILIFMGTNDYNNGVPIGEWYTETFDSVRVALHKPSEMVQRRHRHFAMDKNTLKGRINIAMSKLKQIAATLCFALRVLEKSQVLALYIVSACPMLLVKLRHIISGNMEMNSKKLFSSPATIEPGHQCSTDIMPYTEDSTRNGSHRIGCKMKSGQGTGKTRILHTNLNTDCYTLLVL